MRYKELLSLHDEIKEHPFWLNFRHDDYRDLHKLWNKAETAMSDIFYVYEENYDRKGSPLFAVCRVQTHDFNAMRCYLYSDPNILTEERFRSYYLVMLQNRLQLMHMLAEHRDKELETVCSFLCNPLRTPKRLQKYVPVFHESWIDATGYVFHSDENSYYAVEEIRESQVDEYIGYLEDAIGAIELKAKDGKLTTTQQHLKEYYEAAIRDIENRTSLIYKIV